MLSINNSNIHLKNCKIEIKYDGPESLQATINETGEKIQVQKVFIIDYNHSYFEPTYFKVMRQIKTFNISLPGLVKTICSYLPPDDLSFEEIEDKKDFFIIIESPKYNNLIQLTKEYLNNESKILNPTIRCKIIYGVASTIKKLHQKKAFGCFLVNENVFLNDKLEPLIGDFGITYIQESDRAGFITHYVRFPYELPPEYLEEDETRLFNSSFDAFSFALFLYRMFSPQVLSDEKINGIYKYINMIVHGERPKRPKNIPDHYWELIQHCWDQNPEHRPTFDEIVEILKDKKFALDEFGEKTNMEDLLEYQTRIDTDNEISNDSNIKKEILDLFIQKVHDQNEDYIIDEDDEQHHEIIEKVGEGATSYTYKAIDRRTGQILCKKILKYQKDQQKAFKNLQRIIQEFEVLYKIQHPCICRSIGINFQEKMKDQNITSTEKSPESTTVSIFLEFLDYNLGDLLQSGINNTLKTRIVIEIVHAMKFIHEAGMIHRDLKIENIMLNSVYEVKIVDFGLVKIYELFDENYSFTQDSLSKGVGSFSYMSPEMLNEKDYDYKTDVYSFGVVLHALFAGCLPKQKLQDKLNGKMIDLPQPSDSISNFCINLIKKCLQADPSDRPSFDEILNDIRENEYLLASFIDKSVVYKKDHELELFEKYQKI